jgi:hypothetical protein
MHTPAPRVASDRFSMVADVRFSPFSDQIGAEPILKALAASAMACRARIETQ